MLQTTRSFWDEETKRGRDKKTKSQRDGGGSSLGWQVHTCHTGAQRDEESKRQKDKETKRHREEETKSQRDCTTRPGGLDSRFLRKERPSVEKGTRTERKM